MMKRLGSSLIFSLVSVATLGAVYSCGSSADAPPAPGFDASGGTGGSTDGGDAAGGVSGGGGSGGCTIFCDDGGNVGCTDVATAVDTDGDTIADEIEGKGDPDHDGKTNDQDDDSDGDGVLDSAEAGPGRSATSFCGVPTDSENDGTPDYLDLDSDGDGLPDAQEPKGCANDCRITPDCDDDPEQVIDVIEYAVGGAAEVCNGAAIANSELYFVVPYGDGEKKKRFSFSTGVKAADIYFLIDTTESMGGAIDNIKTSLNTKIIPTILNGDATANPPIPAIPDAYIGLGDVRDVPWFPWGAAGDHVYRWFYDVGGNHVVGEVSAPLINGTTKSAPQNVVDILSVLTAGGGGDSPEATTQGLYLAATNSGFRYTAGGLWPPNPPSGNFDASEWDQECSEPGRIGRACFRPGKLPIFAIITDAGMHNGPEPTENYKAGGECTDPSRCNVNGTTPYAAVLSSLNAINAKVVGVSVNTGLPGQARSELSTLATDTGSVYATPGGTPKPLVTTKDTTSGDVSSELVRLIGLLAGQGLNNVTTVRDNYSCPGNVDCTGDSVPDEAYVNPSATPGGQPFDATQLVTAVTPVPVAAPTPYTSIDATTFYGVRGENTVEFEVHAQNGTINPVSPLVFRVLLRVQTPNGQALGGVAGVKMIYLVVTQGSIG